MLKQNSSSSISIDISTDEIGVWVASRIRWRSEANMEEFADFVTEAIDQQITRKVEMATRAAKDAAIRKAWVALHPPNHAGFYYCHIMGEWVHVDHAALEHIVPKSVAGPINMDEPGWDEKLRMACHPHNFLKGSSQNVKSATLEFAPPDEAC